MISIQTALKRKDELKCLIGYSGKIINSNHLSINILSKPKIYLMHGEDDQVVPINHILESKDFLLTHGFNITKNFQELRT